MLERFIPGECVDFVFEFPRHAFAHMVPHHAIDIALRHVLSWVALRDRPNVRVTRATYQRTSVECFDGGRSGRRGSRTLRMELDGFICSYRS